MDALLKKAGTDKSRVLEARIWLKHMKDFQVLNKVWNEWVHETEKGVRFCVEANLARPDLLVEIQLTAALR